MRPPATPASRCKVGRVLKAEALSAYVTVAEQIVALLDSKVLPNDMAVAILEVMTGYHLADPSLEGLEPVDALSRHLYAKHMKEVAA